MADHPILKWWPVAVAVLSGVAAFAKLESDVSNLKERVDRLEQRVDPLRDVKIGKGDLCLQILKELNTSTAEQQQHLQAEFDKSGCQGLPAGETVPDNSSERRGTPHNAVTNAD